MILKKKENYQQLDDLIARAVHHLPGGSRLLDMPISRMPITGDDIALYRREKFVHIFFGYRFMLVISAGGV